MKSKLAVAVLAAAGIAALSSTAAFASTSTDKKPTAPTATVVAVPGKPTSVVPGTLKAVGTIDPGSVPQGGTTS
jgi:proline-rich tail region repeat protein